MTNTKTTPSPQNQVYNNYEIHPCTRTEEPDRPGHFYFEQCEPHEADVWTLYGHLPEGGVEAIADFCSREAAEQTFQRITGIPWCFPAEIGVHLLVMHSGQKLQEAIQQISHFAANANCTPDGMAAALNAIASITDRALAEAAGRAA